MLQLAEHISHWSKDPSTKCGAVIYDYRYRVHFGYNGFPDRLNDDRLDDREYKYDRILHAEANAILNAGSRVRGQSIVTWPFRPCKECAKLIIGSGIDRVVHPAPYPERWGPSFLKGTELFREAGLEIINIPEVIDMTKVTVKESYEDERITHPSEPGDASTQEAEPPKDQELREGRQATGADREADTREQRATRTNLRDDLIRGIDPKSDEDP